MEKRRSLLYKYLPYIMLFAFSLCVCMVYFYTGLNKGDDITYHFANITDEYKSLTSSYKLSAISGNLGKGIGVGNRLFYSPLAHISVSLLWMLIDGFGLGVVQAYKIVVFLTIYISSIFFYRFMMHFTTNNNNASLIAALIYIVYPYRLFDAFCRVALAETYAFLFLPLFFMGLYDLLHMKKINIIAFIEVIIGASGLYLSHNLTAFYCYTFAVIYLLFNVKYVVKAIKIKGFMSYALFSIFLIIGLSSISLFSQMELMRTDMYNLTNRVRMWTNVDQVVKRAKEEMSYSGFLNYTYLSAKYKDLTEAKFILEMALFALLSSAILFIDYNLAKIKSIKWFKYVYHFISYGLFVLAYFTIFKRIEIFLAINITYFAYKYVYYMSKRIDDKEFVSHSLFKDVNFYYCLFMIPVLLIMMHEGWVWEKLPALFLNIQFPWRLWAFVQLYVSILVGLICTYYRPLQIVKFAFVILAGFFLVANEPLIEKRMVYENYTGKETKIVWYMEMDDSIMEQGSSLGWNREYIPQVFYQSGYKSEYANSLYSRVQKIIKASSQGGYQEYAIKPVILTKNNGITNNPIEIISAYSPFYDMKVTTTKKETIQMPLIYYPGYKITLINTETNEATIVEAINIDGLIAFEIPRAGSYEIKTEYVGTPLRQVSFAYFYVSIAGLIMLIGLIGLNKKKEQMEAMLENVI